jgi:hypothetical protein
MKNIYIQLKELAKSVRAQNLFIAAKDLSGIRIFRNTGNLSKLQGIYLSNLYTYDAIYRDIAIDKISEKVLIDEIFEEAYLLWKHKNIKKTLTKDKERKDLKLVPGKHIKFPKRA